MTIRCLCPFCGAKLGVQKPGTYPCHTCHKRVRMGVAAPAVLNHKLHIGLCLLTCGLWVPIYGYLLIVDSQR